MIDRADTSCACELLPAVNFGPRRVETIDMLMLHYTGMESGPVAVDWLCTEESGVSCHYLVHEDGAIVQMVSEADRAWHAGAGSWRGHEDINSRSIGIEIVNPGHEFNYPDFPAIQMDAVIKLCADIIARHGIAARNVIAHSDSAPGRKRDPGEKFPWALLHEAGIGHFVPQAEPQIGGLCEGDSGDEVLTLQRALALYGYGLEKSGVFDRETRQCVAAFQRHFRPARVDGIADASTVNTLRRLIEALEM